MKQTIILITLLLIISQIHGQNKQSTSDQLFNGKTENILKPLPQIIGWIDNENYIEFRRNEEGKPIYITVNAKSGKETVNAENKKKGAHVEIKNSDIYYTDEKGVSTKITNTAGEEKNPTLSPDGKYIAYTLNNNLFTYDITTQTEHKLTTDGSDVILNGYASWVIYEEILGRPSNYKTFWWSPDSKTLVFFRCDDTKVPMFPIYVADGQHGYIEQTHYPKAGDPNPEVKIGFVKPEGSEITWADFNPQKDQYFGQPFWTPDSQSLWLQWMPREQNELTIYSINPQTGSKTSIYKETQPTWVDWFENITFLKDGFIIKSDKTGWANLYLMNLDGSLKNNITSGEYTVKDIKYIDEKSSELYFTARKENSTRIDYYKVKFDGTKLQRLTFGDYYNTIIPSPDGKYFITVYSNSVTPPAMTLVDNKGKIIRKLGNSKADQFDKYNWAKSEIITIPTEDNFNLPVKITYPVNFDPQKKYPVLVKIYGGPDMGTVYDKWTGINMQWFAQEGLLQLEFDHRGSGHFGKKGMNYLHRNLCKWEMNDYITCAKYFRAQPYVDNDRFAIMGGSFGGTMTAMAMTYASDYFTHGIAEFGVMDWRLYDSHYTERYMDTPTDNPEGYDFASVLNHVKKYKGEDRMLIIHGTTDDNVHLQNSIQLIAKLQEEKKLFQMMFYPNCRHGWRGNQKIHWDAIEAQFIYEKLLNKTFPAKEFDVE